MTSLRDSDLATLPRVATPASGGWQPAAEVVTNDGPLTKYSRASHDCDARLP